MVELLVTFGATFGTRKLFSKKYTHAGSPINTTLLRFVYTILPSKFSNLRRKTSLTPLLFADYYRKASKVKTGNLKSIQKNLHISEKITTFAAKYIANQFKSYEKNNPIWHGARSTQRMLQTRTNIRLHRGQVL